MATANGIRMYPATAAGLFTCFAEALPFWGRTLAGDLLFSAAIFGIYELLARRAGAERTATA
jgi:hypothetical protein